MKLFKSAVLPALSGWITALLFLCICAFCLMGSSDPSGLLRVLPVMGCLLGAMVCGGATYLLSSEKRGETALFSGLLLVVLQALCSLFPGGGKSVIFALALAIGQTVISFLVFWLCQRFFGGSKRKKIKRSVRQRTKRRWMQEKEG